MSTWIQLTLTTLAWAISFHAGKYLVEIMPPLGAAIWRFALASLFLLPWVSWRQGWSMPALWRNRLALLFMGCIGIAGFQLGMFFGLEESTADNAALIMGFNPALTIALAAVVDRRAIRGWQLFGLLLGLAGVVVVVTHGSWQALMNRSLARGDLYLAAGALTWAAYSVVLRRVTGLGVMQITASTVLICTLSMVVVAIAVTPASLALPPAAAWLPLLFVGVIGAGFAYVWWNSAVMRVGPSRASIFMNLVPVATILVGVAFGEAVTQAQLIGAGLVIGGVMLATHA